MKAGYGNAGQKAAVGVEPTNNGFANRLPIQDKSQESQHLQQNEKSVLASCLALLAEKDPDLALVVERWPDLPEYIRQSIKALVKTGRR